MPYYTRIFGTSNPEIEIDELNAGLSIMRLKAKFKIIKDKFSGNETIIIVSNTNGDEIMLIERNPVIDGELGKEELEEFRNEIKNYKPISAVKWLDKFFNKVKVIYAMQLLGNSSEKDYFSIINAIQLIISTKTEGIIQADNEGFTNEDGNQILWQFSDTVTGVRDCAVKNFWGKWVNFKMDLGDKQQREEFMNGEVPKNAIKI